MTTVLVGAHLIVALSPGADLPTWEAKAGFAVRVGALVWLVAAVSVYGYARWRR